MGNRSLNYFSNFISFYFQKLDKVRSVLLLVIWLGAFAMSQAFGVAVELDSLGLEVNGDTTYVRHKVSKKETLYGLSKRYHSTVEAIVNNNPEVKDGLSVGKIIRVPYRIDQLGKVHQVTAGETLYSIALFYQLEVGKLMAWNKLESHELKVGQKLNLSDSPATSKPKQGSFKRVPGITYHTVAPSETLYAIAKKYKVSIAALKEWNQLTGNDLQPGQLIAVSEKKDNTVDLTSSGTTVSNKPTIEPQATPKIEPTPPTSTTDIEPLSGEMVKEQGIAEVIKGDYGSKKYLALHRSAPVGTIMQVKNEMNNLSIFVRVIGQLPNTGNNQNLILKISKAAQERLGVLDDQFRVEISYIP
ncbi:MAG: LysM peptidoglycan-binding domain-containing protein [Cyclobacteriaceae bacterium]